MRRRWICRLYHGLGRKGVAFSEDLVWEGDRRVVGDNAHNCLLSLRSVFASMILLIRLRCLEILTNTSQCLGEIVIFVDFIRPSVIWSLRTTLLLPPPRCPPGQVAQTADAAQLSPSLNLRSCPCVAPVALPSPDRQNHACTLRLYDFHLSKWTFRGRISVTTYISEVERNQGL